MSRKKPGPWLQEAKNLNKYGLVLLDFGPAESEDEGKHTGLKSNKTVWIEPKILIPSSQSINLDLRFVPNVCGLFAHSPFLEEGRTQPARTYVSNTDARIVENQSWEPLGMFNSPTTNLEPSERYKLASLVCKIVGQDKHEWECTPNRQLLRWSG